MHGQQPLDGRRLNDAERHGPGGEDRHRFLAVLVQGVEHAGHFVVRARQPLADGLAGDEQLLLEMGQRRRLPDEGVRFLQQGNDADPHGGRSRLENEAANQGCHCTPTKNPRSPPFRELPPDSAPARSSCLV